MKQNCITIPLLFVAVAALSPAMAKDPAIQMGDGPDGMIRDGKPVSRGWTKLFDGKSLNGWMGEKGYWEIKDGAIVGTQPPHAPLHHYLFSTKDYSDFELHIDVKLVGYNSGVCIRIAPETYDSVPGYQVDMGDGYWGCLWEEHKRETRVFTYPKEEADKILHKDDWNHYFVRAVSHHITIYLNGVKTVDGDDPQGLLSGPLGFQLCHSGPEVASFKNIYIKTYKPPTKGTAPLPPVEPTSHNPVTLPTAPGAAAPPAAPAFDHKTFLRGHGATDRDAFLSTIGLIAACRTNNQLAAGDGDDWTVYWSRDGRFIAKFPETPSASQSQRAPSTSGVRYLKSVVSSGPTGKDAYLVMYMSLGTTPDRATQRAALNGAAHSVGGQGNLLSNTFTTFRGYPARDVVVAKEVAGERAIIDDMIFIVRERLYQIMTVLPRIPNHAALTRRFQAGFRLLPTH